MDATEQMTEMFGEIISSYTRAQAIEDGVLIDVSDTEAAKLFKHPCAITSSLFGELVRGAGSKQEIFNARLHDVLWMMQVAGRREGGSDIFFKVKVGRLNLGRVSRYKISRLDCIDLGRCLTSDRTTETANACG